METISKAKYKEEDIIFINSSKYDYVTNEYKDILNFIDDNNIVSFKQLTEMLRKTERDELLFYVSKNTLYVNYYIQDCKNHVLKDIEMMKSYIHKLIEQYDLQGVLTIDDNDKKVLELFSKYDIVIDEEDG